MGEEWEKKWDEIPIFFHGPISPIFPKVEDLPHNALGESQLTTVTDGKWESSTLRRSPPQRPVWMAV